MKRIGGIAEELCPVKSPKPSEMYVFMYFLCQGINRSSSLKLCIMRHTRLTFAENFSSLACILVDARPLTHILGSHGSGTPHDGWGKLSPNAKGYSNWFRCGCMEPRSVAYQSTQNSILQMWKRFDFRFSAKNFDFWGVKGVFGPISGSPHRSKLEMWFFVLKGNFSWQITWLYWFFKIFILRWRGCISHIGYC